MSLNTFSFNQSEAESIISQVNVPGQFLHTPVDQIKTRDLEKVCRRKTALQLHYVTLAEYHKVQRIPRGLRVPLRPTLFSEKDDFCEKFEAILHKCSLDLILLTVDYLHKEIPMIETEINNIEQQLRNTLSQDEFNKIKTQTDKTINEFQSQLQERKRLKFVRDTDDYQRSESDNSRSSFRQYEQRRGRSSRSRGSRRNPAESSTTTRMQTRSQELNRFYRSLRLKVHFSKFDTLTPVSQISTVSNDNEILTLKKLNLTLRSSFSPPKIYHPVETFISLIQKDVDKQLSDIQHSLFHVSSNMTRAEKLAINSLRSNKKLIIKPAEKGGAVVVMDKQYYIREIRSQLSDCDVYLPISHDPTFKFTKEIQALSHQFCTLGVIDHKLGEFLVNTHPICPVLYILPKIHKNLTSPPGRPIVASTGSLLSPLAIVLEKILSPLMVHIPSFLRDTSHFLTYIRDLERVPTDCYLVSLDVNSLYTNIDNEKGILAVVNFLNHNTQFHCELKVFCRTLLTFILTKNFFLFEDEFFLQRNGTAMGSNVAPPYANIFMADFESNFVYTHPLFQQYCLLWKRFIDDIFLVWCGDIESLMSFYQYINQCVTKLTFTIHYDQKSISFLDTQIIVNEDGSLASDLYVKPTDKNSLLLFSSCHPHHIKKALPLSQFQRINRIVSESSQRTLRLKDMALKFQNRGYPDTLLKHSSEFSISRRVRDDTRRMAFVSTHHPFMRLFHRIIHKHWPLLGLSYPDIPEFLSPPLMCHKKPPNLRNLLVSADVGSSRREMRQISLSVTRKGTYPCLHCLQCSNISKGDTFTHPRSGKRFPIRNYYNCDSTYVIYLIKCPCGLGYVGETTQHIRDRISQHKSTIRCKRIMLPIPAHFIAHNHNISQLRYQVIDHVPIARRGGNRILKLKEKEAYWIHTLQTLEPKGLNRGYELFY
ncbi:unnamed protein product [Ranitomeya imitator]|uniref:Reverse transcriptase domain-containing protein n=1 Tax=Ranitomeya imitator TaxID=111125 RepID=A0ABN9L0T2_9NEOB|nr:unnamed protein product [Ranitomeya imitator]